MEADHSQHVYVFYIFKCIYIHCVSSHLFCVPCAPWLEVFVAAASARDAATATPAMPPLSTDTHRG
jgi:hypothetical protein